MHVAALSPINCRAEALRAQRAQPSPSSALSAPLRVISCRPPTVRSPFATQSWFAFSDPTARWRVESWHEVRSLRMKTAMDTPSSKPPTRMHASGR